MITPEHKVRAAEIARKGFEAMITLDRSFEDFEAFDTFKKRKHIFEFTSKVAA